MLGSGSRARLRGYRSSVPYGRIITASCTTGWLDWIHGELWLFPEGLLRVRTSLATTLAHQNLRTVSDEPQGRDFSYDEIKALVTTKRNLWIEADRIERADVHVGVMTGRVNLRMRGGRKIKLLWLRSDHAERALSTALASWNVET